MIIPIVFPLMSTVYLTSYLRGVDGGNSHLLTEGTRELRDKLDMRIGMLRNAGIREHYERIRVHRIEIYKYRKDKGRSSIVFQAAVEYIHYQEQNGGGGKGGKFRRFHIRKVPRPEIQLQHRTVTVGAGLGPQSRQRRAAVGAHHGPERPGC